MKTITPVAVVLLLLAGAAVAVAPGTAPGGFWKPMGEYRVTGYAACVACCGKSDGITADGTYAPGFKGRLASAPKDIPFGTKLWVEGVGLVEVHDRGGAIKGRRLELFFQTYNEARQWGVQKRQVWIWNNGG
jgi:3D (Asp-Asp-Asp) domain-containing protein